MLKAVKKQLGAEVKKREEAQQAAKTAVEKAEAQCELQVSEMRKLLARARTSIIAAEKDVQEAEARADAAEARADVAEARADAAEEAAAEEVVMPICPHCGKRGPSPPPQVYSDLMTESEPSSVC